MRTARAVLSRPDQRGGGGGVASAVGVDGWSPRCRGSGITGRCSVGSRGWWQRRGRGDRGAAGAAARALGSYRRIIVLQIIAEICARRNYAINVDGRDADGVADDGIERGPDPSIAVDRVPTRCSGWSSGS